MMIHEPVKPLNPTDRVGQSHLTTGRSHERRRRALASWVTRSQAQLQVPSGNDSHSYGKWRFIVRYSEVSHWTWWFSNIFHTYVKLPWITRWYVEVSVGHQWICFLSFGGPNVTEELLPPENLEELWQELLEAHGAPNLVFNWKEIVWTCWKIDETRNTLSAACPDSVECRSLSREHDHVISLITHPHWIKQPKTII